MAWRRFLISWFVPASLLSPPARLSPLRARGPFTSGDARRKRDEKSATDRLFPSNIRSVFRGDYVGVFEKVLWGPHRRCRCMTAPLGVHFQLKCCGAVSPRELLRPNGVGILSPYVFPSPVFLFLFIWVAAVGLCPLSSQKLLESIGWYSCFLCR